MLASNRQSTSININCDGDVFMCTTGSMQSRSGYCDCVLMFMAMKGTYFAYAHSAGMINMGFADLVSIRLSLMSNSQRLLSAKGS